MIRAHYDPQVDALAINWGDERIVESDEIASGVILDYDKDGNVIGIEVLDASKQIKQLEGKPLFVTAREDLKSLKTKLRNDAVTDSLDEVPSQYLENPE